MWKTSSTARRIGGAFGALFLLFGAATVLALAGLSQMHDALHDVRDREGAVRAALALSRAVRDQYAHQAHTIIIGDTSHLVMYEDARQAVVKATAESAARTRDPAERERIDAIARTSGEMDRLFRGEVVPAVIAHDTDRVSESHNQLLGLVGDVETQADALADRYETQIGVFEANAARVENTAFRGMGLLGVVAMLFALVIGAYIARSVARPVAVLGAGAARLATGDLATRIEIAGDDEFGRLAKQFNTMAATLAGHQATLAQAEKLAGIGRLAAGVAHELNNPLGVILGYARLLGRKAEGELRTELGIIEDEAKRAQFIVEGLLELARPIKVDDAVVDLRAICTETVSRLRDSGGAVGVVFEVVGEARARGTETRLRQVIQNLAGNAARAAGDGGRVELRLSDGVSGVSVTVTDTGAGVSEEARGRLFEPFFTTRAEGTGLGLAVSRAIARAHGGELEFVPTAAPGATFALKLPRVVEGGA